MEPDLSLLDDRLNALDVDGYLLYADSTESDQYYLSGFDAPDPFVTLYDGSVRLLFSRSLEYGRAVRESRAESVERGSDYDYDAHIDAHGAHEGWYRTLAAFLDSYDIGSVATPPRFPLSTADGLRGQNIEVTAEESGIITEIRAVKTAEEIEHLRAAQRANEAAMARAEELISESDVEDGTLVHGGEPLTSERVREEIELTLLRHGCGLDETIVACGRDAADPHDRGSGPLSAGEAVIIDIFPRHKTNRYHADMTRTFCKGEPSDTLQEWYALTQEAKEAALSVVEPGVTGEEVHAAACEVYEAAGLPTLRADPTTETGFIHSTGHGLGLDVHELPRVSTGGQELKPGHVITIEPGLYDPAVGGVRIEDFVVITDDGYENLVRYDESLVV